MSGPDRTSAQAEDTKAKHQRKQRALTKPAASRTLSIADAIVIKERDVFFLAEPDAAVPLHEGHGYGLYYHDCRFLNGYQLKLAGTKPQALGANASAGFMSVFELTNHDLIDHEGRGVGKESLGIRWKRVLSGEHLELYDCVSITNYASHPVTLPLDFAFRATFEDIFVVRGMLHERPGKLHPPHWHEGALQFGYDGIDGLHRRLAIRFSPAPIKQAESAAHFIMHLKPAESADIEISLSIVETRAGAAAQPALVTRAKLSQIESSLQLSEKRSLAKNVETTTPSAPLQKALDRALRDLHLLKTHYNRDEFFAAGVPWFTTLFGRDSIITSLFMLAYDRGVAEQTLHLLASYQGRREDAWTEEQPGKILHELRRDELTNADQIPYTPYYGTIDATILFLILIGEHARWSGDLHLFEALQDNVERALQWIDQYGKIGDKGYVAYTNHAENGLINEGWKDSTDAIVNADGTLATPPIALVEVQGYVYCAKQLIADLYHRRGDTERARKLRHESEQLRERFNRDFWLHDKSFYALALQKDERPCAVISSNPGQALWTGIVDAAKAKNVMRQLMAAELFSGWGIRTLSKREQRYNPIGYHLGTVWPHDNALIAAGLRRYGFDEAALKVASGIVDASSYFNNHRLPELFSGFERGDYGVPVRYPVACHPQAWAAASVPFFIVTLLGLEPHAFEQRLRVVRPILPAFVPSLQLRDLRVGQGRVDLSATRGADGKVDVKILRVDGKLDVEIQQS